MTIKSNLKVFTILYIRMKERNITKRDIKEITGFSCKRIRDVLKLLNKMNLQLFCEMCEILEIKEIRDLLTPKSDNL